MLLQMSRANLVGQLLAWHAARAQKSQLQPDLALSSSFRIREQSRDPRNLRYRPARTTALDWRPRLPSIAPASGKPLRRLCCPATRKIIRPPAGDSARWVRAPLTASIR